MLANLRQLHKDDGRPCVRDMEQVKTLPRAHHHAGATRVSAVQAPTIFHGPWWLEAATAGPFKEVATHDTNGAMTGRLPYFRVMKQNGQSAIVMPTLTHMLGPALSEKLAEANTVHLTKRLAITRDLVAQLPESSHISFLLHGGVTDTLAYRELGFSTSVAFTVGICPAPLICYGDKCVTCGKALRDQRSAANQTMRVHDEHMARPFP
jgi:hypothetical protein